MIDIKISYPRDQTLNFRHTTKHSVPHIYPNHDHKSINYMENLFFGKLIKTKISYVSMTRKKMIIFNDENIL